MKNSLRQFFFMPFILACTAMLALFALPAFGQTTTFAQFFEQNGSQDFVWTNNGGSFGTFGTVPGGSPIFFTYQNVAGLPPELQGIQFAHMTVTTAAFQAGQVLGGNVIQPLDQQITIEITRDTPASPGTGGGDRRRLLQVVITPAITTPALTGGDGGNSANLSVSTPDHNVTFSSHFLVFTSTTSRNMALSFSSVTPAFSLGLGGFLQSVTAAASGTFAADPVPVYAGPTAADVRLAGRVLKGNGAPASGLTVKVAEQDGTVHTARTSSFGFFSFEGLRSGQSVVVSVASKAEHYQPQIVSLDDSALDLVLTPSN